MNEYSRSAFLQHADFDKDAYNKKYYRKNKQWKKNYNHDYYLKNKDKWGLGGGTTTTTTKQPNGTSRLGKTPGEKVHSVGEKVGDAIISVTPGMNRLYKGSSREFINSLSRGIGSIVDTAKKAKEWWDSSNINPQEMFNKINEIQSKIDKIEKDIQARKDAFSKKLSNIRKILGI